MLGMALGHQTIALPYSVEYVTKKERNGPRGEIYNSCYISYNYFEQQERCFEDAPNARASTITSSEKGFQPVEFT